MANCFSGKNIKLWYILHFKFNFLHIFFNKVSCNMRGDRCKCSLKFCHNFTLASFVCCFKNSFVRLLCIKIKKAHDITKHTIMRVLFVIFEKDKKNNVTPNAIIDDTTECKIIIHFCFIHKVYPSKRRLNVSCLVANAILIML